MPDVALRAPKRGNLGSRGNADEIRILYKNRSKEIESFLQAVKDESFTEIMNDDAAFSSFLKLSIDEYGVKHKDIASILRINVSQIGRWCSGANFPKPYTRPQIVDAVSKLISKKLIEFTKHSPTSSLKIVD